MTPLRRALVLPVIFGISLGTPVSPESSRKTERAVGPDGRGTYQGTLRLVTVVMRHGERAPQDTYPNDPYIGDPMEPYGWGQLTNEGRRSQYDQGVFLRRRYDGFLGETYSPDIFHLQCTAVDRTKMSAMLEAAGLWKPSEKQSFKSDLPWQPVTLYYQPREEDTLMLIWETCPMYAKLRSEVMDTLENRQVQRDNERLYEELTNLTGMPIANPDDVGSLYGTLRAEDVMNLTLPEWTAEYYPERLEPLTLYGYRLNVYNDRLRRLKGGPLLKRVVTSMLDRSTDTLEPARRKMYMYVGHDSTVVTVLDTMRVWFDQMPDYNVMTMIELHESPEIGWNVQLFIRNSTDKEPYPLTVPGCETACPLHEFVRILKPMIPDDWVEECKVDDSYTLPPAPVP